MQTYHRSGILWGGVRRRSGAKMSEWRTKDIADSGKKLLKVIDVVKKLQKNQKINLTLNLENIEVIFT